MMTVNARSTQMPHAAVMGLLMRVGCSDEAALRDAAKSLNADRQAQGEQEHSDDQVNQNPEDHQDRRGAGVAAQFIGFNSLFCNHKIAHREIFPWSIGRRFDPWTARHIFTYGMSSTTPLQRPLHPSNCRFRTLTTQVRRPQFQPADDTRAGYPPQQRYSVARESRKRSVQRRAICAVERRHLWATEQTARRACASVWGLMPDLLQQLDVDYYRAARLLIARAELEQLRQECSRSADIEGEAKSLSARQLRWEPNGC